MLSLLETEFPFEIAILYGRYTGGRMRSEQEGYELLLVTQGEPGREGWELEEYLKGKYPTVSRTEWTLHIETVDIHTLNNTNTSNWFFWNIRMEGTIIRDSGKTQGIFRKTQFRHGKAYKLARRQYDHFFTNGSDMLDEAVRMWNAGKPSLAAIDLSYAAQFLLRAEETVFYGNFIHTPNLQKSFRRARVSRKGCWKSSRWTNGTTRSSSTGWWACAMRRATTRILNFRSGVTSGFSAGCVGCRISSGSPANVTCSTSNTARPSTRWSRSPWRSRRKNVPPPEVRRRGLPRNATTISTRRT